MKKVSLLAVIAAILCGVLLYLYTNGMAKRVESATALAKKNPELATVVVAVQDIPPFTPIQEEMVTLKDFPLSYVDSMAATDLNQVIGLQSNGTIYTGEMIFANAVTSAEESDSSLSYRIPDGMRAMTINVSISQGVGGYLTVGDYVDVIECFTTDQAETIFTDKGKQVNIAPATVADIAAEGVEILALGSNGYTGEDGDIYGTVTLQLSPEQCFAITAASGMGASFTLTLRQRGANSHEYDGTATYTELR